MNLNISATNGKTYTWDELGPVALVRVDSRLANGVYVHTYAPVSDTVSGVDMSAAFEDVWQEVVEA